MNTTLSAWQAFSLGFVGGVLAEIAHLFTIRKSLARKVPNYMKTWVYWIITFLMAISGGVLSMVNLYRTPASPMLAVQIGILAPVLIHKISQVGVVESGAKSPNLKPPNWLSILRGE